MDNAFKLFDLIYASDKLNIDEEFEKNLQTFNNNDEEYIDKLSDELKEFLKCYRLHIINALDYAWMKKTSNCIKYGVAVGMEIQKYISELEEC